MIFFAEASVLDCVEASTNPQQGPWASEGCQPQQSCVGAAAERVALLLSLSEEQRTREIGCPLTYPRCF